MRVVFRPNPDSRSRVTGTIQSRTGTVLTILYDGQIYTRDYMTDDVRETDYGPEGPQGFESIPETPANP